MEGALIVNGRWGGEGVDCCIINIYAPCSTLAKIDLWDRLVSVVMQNSLSCVCLGGDFNSIRRSGERVGRSSELCNRDIEAFDEFIRETGLLDMPLHGRSFTCYRPDGTCKSRLDRILVNHRWLSQWPNATQLGLQRTLSDHCPILLEIKVRDWGPKPFRFFNAWLLHTGFSDFVRGKWEDYSVEGLGGYVLKEKLKFLKMDLKNWNKEVFGARDSKIEERKLNIFQLDIIDEVLGLDENEIILRNKERALLTMEIKKRDSLLWQKARSKWVREGDANTSFFHKCINKRRKNNEMVGIRINGVWREEVEDVRKRVFDFFNLHFKARRHTRPSLCHDFVKSRVSVADNELLVENFSEDEVKNAIEMCDGSKSPGPDGFNMEFFKKFWDMLKNDIMRIMREFHQYGRLVRGLNNSFIVLIPKKVEAEELHDYRPISLIGGYTKSSQRYLQTD